ncbi:MAG: hypothetical protein WAX80_01080 [Minisyncoccia bacterium]
MMEGAHPILMLFVLLSTAVPSYFLCRGEIITPLMRERRVMATNIVVALAAGGIISAYIDPSMVFSFLLFGMGWPPLTFWIDW